MSRELICPAVYKHFKGMHYATMCCSSPVDIDELSSYANHLGKKNIFHFCYITSTYSEDLSTEISIFKFDDKYYHLSTQSCDDLVIYRPLYPFRFTSVARPKDMFLSKVDKEKYPDVEQEYRFELVKY